MPVEITQSSPQANAIREGEVAKKKGPKSPYPFDKLAVGQSFTVPVGECNVDSLRTMMYQRNKKHRDEDGEDAREYTCVIHKDLGLVEVARIA